MHLTAMDGYQPDIAENVRDSAIEAIADQASDHPAADAAS
jgi:hypothetical protein